MMFRIQRKREIWLEENRKDQKEAMSRYKSNCVAAKISWLDDCQSYPMDILKLDINSGIAATLVVTCLNGHEVSIKPKKSESNLRRYSRNGCNPKLYELNQQLVTGVQSCGGGGMDAATLVASLGLPHGYNINNIF